MRSAPTPVAPRASARPDPLGLLLGAALAAVDARTLTRRALSERSGELRLGGTVLRASEVERLFVVGAGKAAAEMARGAQDALGGRIHGGTVTTKDGYACALPGIEVWEAGHPLPDARGLAGAAGALRLARRAGERDVVLSLLSGGASALWAAPAPGIFLGDVRAVTDALQRAGAPIEEVNTVRKHLSAIAGGRLAQLAWPARVVTLAIADVIGVGDDVIGSGPTLPDPTTYADALDVLDRRGVAVPQRVFSHLRAGVRGQRAETPKLDDERLERSSFEVLARNRDALDAAACEARRAGLEGRIVSNSLRGEAKEAAREIVAHALRAAEQRAPGAPPLALLWGGETTVTVRGEGRGGRCQELALAAATLLDGTRGIRLAALGTDGTDGPTDAAGAVVDGRTAARARARGLDPHDHLERNDSYPLLRATGALIRTGPTGTNVNDVVVALVG